MPTKHTPGPWRVDDEDGCIVAGQGCRVTLAALLTKAEGGAAVDGGVPQRASPLPERKRRHGATDSLHAGQRGRRRHCQSHRKGLNMTASAKGDE